MLSRTTPALTCAALQNRQAPRLACSAVYAGVGRLSADVGDAPAAAELLGEALSIGHLGVHFFRAAAQLHSAWLCTGEAPRPLSGPFVGWTLPVALYLEGSSGRAVDALAVLRTRRDIMQTRGLRLGAALRADATVLAIQPGSALGTLPYVRGRALVEMGGTQVDCRSAVRTLWQGLATSTPQSLAIVSEDRTALDSLLRMCSGMSLPGHSHLTRKHLLPQLLERAGCADLAPPTAVLLRKGCTAELPADSSRIWFLKRASASRGRGVAVATARERDEEISRMDGPSFPLVVQAAAEPPLCVDGRKASLRVYALAASNPLRFWVYEEAVLSLATAPYTGSTERHLQVVGTDWSSFQPASAALQDRWPSLRDAIFGAVHKALCAAWPREPCAHNGFQLLGFDFQPTGDGTPALLEVNASPALQWLLHTSCCAGMRHVFRNVLTGIPEALLGQPQVPPQCARKWLAL
eukprot:TRINITY_DN11633_c0_g1_i1.p1 TRINITY_DN11633_c0_g1~~TRINITY_DN11633_c0_g1_i1.p1  ORF type:complete len:465 (+),score=85.33 TRINITY_DN11633_c0_g1_i1:296-1690(+)